MLSDRELLAQMKKRTTSRATGTVPCTGAGRAVMRARQASQCDEETMGKRRDLAQNTALIMRGRGVRWKSLETQD